MKEEAQRFQLVEVFAQVLGDQLGPDERTLLEPLFILVDQPYVGDREGGERENKSGGDDENKVTKGFTKFHETVAP